MLRSEKESRMTNSRMTNIYYAHCQSLYGTVQEVRDESSLRVLGFHVVNPNNVTAKARCAALTVLFEPGKTHVPNEPVLIYEDVGAQIMHEIFKPMVLS